jgi:hypothetical protein
MVNRPNGNGSNARVPEDFLTREHGENLNTTFELLCKPEIKHLTAIRTSFDIYSKNQAIDAAICVLELYKKALESREKIVLSDNSTKTGIEYITVELDSPFDAGSAPIVILDCGMEGWEKDIKAIRENLIKGASQIPQNLDSDHITCIFIGTFVPDLSDIEKGSLHGEVKYKNGMFNDDAEVVELRHIKTVVFFNLNYDYAEVGNGTNCVKLLRSCRDHKKEALFNNSQKELLEDFKKNYISEEFNF